jgi:drug/metabolite transporter (DMT)-like permease
MKNEKSLAWLAFAAVSVFWGTTFFAIRVGVTSFPPMLMAGFRHSIGGILICSYFLLKGYKFPALKELKVFAVNGILMLSLGNGLVTWAEIYVSSGLAALICALTPIWIVLLNSFTGVKEKITGKILIGFLICLTGQFLIFNDNLKDFANPYYTLGIIAIIVANLSWAIGTLYSKNQKTVTHPFFGAGLQMLSGGFVLDVIGTVKGEWAELHPTAESIFAMLYLVFFGSIVAFGAYMYVLKKLPTTIVSTYAYINTIVAVLLGWLFLNEKLNFILAFAIFLTIAGVWMVSRAVKKSH